MNKLIIAAAAAAALWVAPAVAGSEFTSGSGMKGSGSHSEHSPSGSGTFSGMGREHGEAIGHERGEGIGRERGEGIEGEREHGRHGRAFGMREGCKYVTVRERHGEEVVIRKFRRCD